LRRKYSRKILIVNSCILITTNLRFCWFEPMRVGHVGLIHITADVCKGTSWYTNWYNIYWRSTSFWTKGFSCVVLKYVIICFLPFLFFPTDSKIVEDDQNSWTATFSKRVFAKLNNFVVVWCPPEKGAYRSEKMEDPVFMWRWSSKFITWHCIENTSPWAAMELSIERWKKLILLCTFLAHRSQMLFCLPFL